MNKLKYLEDLPFKIVWALAKAELGQQFPNVKLYTLEMPSEPNEGLIQSVVVGFVKDSETEGRKTLELYGLGWDCESGSFFAAQPVQFQDDDEENTNESDKIE